MKFYKLDKEAVLPTKAHKTDAGYDLYSVEDVTIHTLQLAKIKTGIAALIPEGYVGLIKDRSSMGSKGIHVFAGVIDHGYNGDISVCLYNTNETKIINKGDKIAQIVIIPILCEEVEETFELPDSERGEKGWGSSGS